MVVPALASSVLRSLATLIPSPSVPLCFGTSCSHGCVGEHSGAEGNNRFTVVIKLSWVLE
jgi:hypothetical protein